MFFISIKEINRLVSKGVSNIYYWKNFFLGQKIWRNALAFKSKKVQGIFVETFILTLSSSALFGLQEHVSDFF